MPRRPHGDTQQRILNYIEEYVEVKGYAPSVREIGQAVDLRSTSTVHGHLSRLEKKGLLRREAMKPRTIDVQREEKQQMKKLPLLGKVAAGSPILAEETAGEFMTLPEEIVGRGDHFMLEIRGDSMITAGILNGDYVVVKKQETANNGEIVIAMMDGDATCKRFFKEENHFRLQPENPTMAPIIVDDVTILGKVTAVIRSYQK